MDDDVDGLFSDEEVHFKVTPEMEAKKNASEIFKRWVVKFGAGYVQSHGHIIASIKQALKVGIPPAQIEYAINRLGAERVPITLPAIQMQLTLIAREAERTGYAVGYSLKETQYE